MRTPCHRRSPWRVSLSALAPIMALLLGAGCGDDDGAANQNNQANQNNNTANSVCGNGVQEPGEECDDGAGNSDLDPDACRSTCRNPSCGDDVVDTGEACDDGNTSSGDGCTDDCSSDESCGNGILDGHVGEECDDGNTDAGDGCSPDCLFEGCGNGILDDGEDCDDGSLRSHDGCSSTCLDEVEAWWPQAPGGSLPTARRNTMMAYDRARDVLVLFGGEPTATTMVNDTWEHDGTAWTRRFAAAGPAARADAHMVYDEARGVTVLFGGSPVVGTYFDDTWEYDGTAWTDVTSQLGNSPPATARGAMVYDAARGVTVLFGGDRSRVATVFTDETWEYDGTTWTPVITLGSPPIRADHAMAYDRQRHVTVLFAGRATANSYLPDTWEYNGVTWTNRTASGGPDQRSDHLMAYDEWRNRMVLFGGYCGDIAGCAYADTWAWDGSTWSPVAASASPENRWSAAGTYFPRWHGVVLFGGYGRPPAAGDYHNDLWILRSDTQPSTPQEACASGADEDGDALVDCEDPDCEGLPCATGRCAGGACQ